MIAAAQFIKKPKMREKASDLKASLCKGGCHGAAVTGGL